MHKYKQYRYRYRFFSLVKFRTDSKERREFFL